MISKLAEFDAPYLKSKRFLAGVDEAGRGALAGVVVAAVAVFKDEFYKNETFLKSIEKLNDSKKLDESARKEIFENLAKLKVAGALDFEAASASVDEIESLNIFGATKLAMLRALKIVDARGALNFAPSSAPATLFGEGGADRSRAEILIDGINLKAFAYRHIAVVKGDAQSLAIAAASIVAKVTRDALMEELALKYPRYDFEVHKGYGTPRHMQNILLHGASPAHRPSFLKNLRADSPAQTQAELF